jgi:hypothetical protein
MVSDVESILKQIRDQVRSEADAAAPAQVVPAETGNPATLDNSYGNAEALARLSAHLTTTGRAWDRLPPIFSNRRGTAARIEIWIKTRLRSLTRWFTWEQVNFNSAVHHALADTLASLQAQEQRSATFRAELTQGLNEIKQRLEEVSGAVEDRALEIRQQNATLQSQQAALNSVGKSAEDLKSWLAAQANDSVAGLARMAGEINTRLAELAADLREEQRVCYKQLSLEATETALADERALRAIESRLENLENMNSGKS